MNCDWTEHTEPDERGWRKVRCLRCGLVTGKTPHDYDHITCHCLAWPRWHEFGNWVETILSALWITKDRVGHWKWRLGLQEPGGCSTCAEYQAWLNSFGGRIVTGWRWLRARLSGS